MRAVVICASRSPIFWSSPRARSGFQERAGHLRGGEIGQFLVTEFLGFFRDIIPDRLGCEKHVLCAFKTDIHLAFKGGIPAENDFGRRILAEQFEAKLRLTQAELIEAALVFRDFLRRNGVEFLPALQISQEILDRAAVRLIFKRRLNPPFPVLPPQLDLVIAIVDYDSVQFLPLEIHHVLGVPPGF